MASTYFFNDLWLDQHLQRNFGKTCLNSTHQNQIAGFIQQKKQNFHRFSYEQQNFKKSNVQSIKPKMKKQSKRLPVSRKSLFIDQNSNKNITLTLRKNKLKTDYKSQANQLWQQSYLNVNAQKMKIHFKEQPKILKFKTKYQNQFLEKQSNNNEKSIFNLTEYVQKSLNNNTKLQKQSKNIEKNPSQKKSIIQNDKENTEKTRQIKDQQNLKKQPVNGNLSIINIGCDRNEPTNIKKNAFDKFINDLQSCHQTTIIDKFKCYSQKAKKQSLKNSKKNNNTTRLNNQDNLKLQRTLRRALSNVSMTSRNYQQNNSTVRGLNINIPSNIIQERVLNNSPIKTQDRHLEKFKQRVKSKVQYFKRADKIKKQQQKSVKQPQKQRKFYSLEPKAILTIESYSIAENKDLKQNKLFKNNTNKYRPQTGISRTGLSYDQKYVKRSVSSNLQRKKQFSLFGVNSTANHYRDFSKNAQRDDNEILIENKSDKAVRKLQQKFQSRPKTSNLYKAPLSTRPSTAITQQSSCPLSQRSSYIRCNDKKASNKQIQKQRLRQRLFEIMIDCQQENTKNQNLRKGLNIFQDYCENIDEGLQNIAREIKEFL